MPIKSGARAELAGSRYIRRRSDGGDIPLPVNWNKVHIANCELVTYGGFADETAT